MLYLLIALTLIFLAFHFWANGRQIVSPTFIAVGLYLFTFVFSLFARDYYGIYDISFDMVLVVMGSFFCMGVGELLALSVTSRRNGGLIAGIRPVGAADKPTVEYCEFRMPLAVVLIFTAFSVFVAYWAMRDLLSFANANGIHGDLITVFSNVRSELAKGKIVYSSGILLSQSTTLCAAFADLCIYVFLYDLVFTGKKQFQYLLPIVGNMLILVSSTGRVAFIRMFTVIVAIAIVFTKTKTGWSTKKDGKIIRISVIVVVAFLVLFRLLGYLTSKSANMDVMENFYHYIAAGVFGFDDFLSSPRAANEVFGQHAFYSVYTILNLFLGIIGARIPLGSQFNESRIIGPRRIGTVMGTGLLVPVQDFGIFGMLISRVLIGYVYQRMLIGLKNRPYLVNNPLAMIFFGIAMYPIVMSSIDDAFRSMVSLGYIYTLIYLLIFIKLFLRKKPAEVAESGTAVAEPTT